MAERAKKRPRIGFFDLGLKKGDVLYYKENPEIEVRVESQRQVTFQGNVTFLSTITCKLKNRDYNCQPSPFWIVKKKGKTLKFLHEEWYKTNL